MKIVGLHVDSTKATFRFSGSEELMLDFALHDTANKVAGLNAIILTASGFRALYCYATPQGPQAVFSTNDKALNQELMARYINAVGAYLAEAPANDLPTVFVRNMFQGCKTQLNALTDVLIG